MARVNSVEEIIAALPGRFLPEQAGDTNATFQFDLSGEGGGQWQARIADRKLEVQPGTAASPNVTISMAAPDFLEMVNGEMNAMSAFMRGKIRVKGDMGLVMKMQKLFNLS